MMRVILLGPPGCGKGTQAKLLSQRQGMVHISTGDVLRDAVEHETPVGLQAKSFMQAGKLVPDEVVNGIIAELFQSPSRPANFLMDGYPRTVAQSKVFEKLLEEVGLPLGGVILLTGVSDDEIVRRITGRLTCAKCKATYHRISNPPKVADRCDNCGTALVRRTDDTEATVRRRLNAYHQVTTELVPHYRERGLLCEITGHGDIESIYREIVTALQRQAGAPC